MKKPLNKMCCYTAARKEGYTFDEATARFPVGSSKSICKRCQGKDMKENLRAPVDSEEGITWMDPTGPFGKHMTGFTSAEPSKPSAMDEAAKVVSGDRQEDYGDAKESFERIASLWSPLLGTPVTAKQVALCMIALKLSRATTSDKHDTVVDIIGYGICLEKIMEVKKP